MSYKVENIIDSLQIILNDIYTMIYAILGFIG